MTSVRLKKSNIRTYFFSLPFHFCASTKKLSATWIFVTSRFVVSNVNSSNSGGKQHLRFKWNIGFFYLRLMMLSTVLPTTTAANVLHRVYTQKQAYWGFALFAVLSALVVNNQWTTPRSMFCQSLVRFFRVPVVIILRLRWSAFMFMLTHTHSLSAHSIIIMQNGVSGFSWLSHIVII